MSVSRKPIRETSHSVKSDLLTGYHQMAADRTREAEALEWCEGLIGDIQDDEG
jgi:hypothetical protein